MHDYEVRVHASDVGIVRRENRMPALGRRQRDMDVRNVWV